MKNRIKNIVIILLVCVIIVMGILLYMPSRENNKILSKEDLKGCKMFVHNLFCDQFEAMAITDQEFYDEVVSLCLNAKKFRPMSTEYDVLIGGYSSHVEMINSSYCYTISLPYPDQQLSFDYIYRDRPLILVSLSKKNDDNARVADSVWHWYCELTPQDYVQLCELIEVRADGEIVTSYRTALWSE